MNLLGNTFVKADTKRLHKDLQAEFSDCHYVSGLLSPNRRNFARYDKAASSFDTEKGTSSAEELIQWLITSTNVFPMLFL